MKFVIGLFVMLTTNFQLQITNYNKPMGFIDSLKKLLSGGKKEEEHAQGQAQEGETSAPKQSGCGHCDSSEGHKETKRESGASEEHSQ